MVTLSILCLSLPALFFSRSRLRTSVWSLALLGTPPHRLSGTGGDGELPKLIGCSWCHSEGRWGLEQRGPPPLDGDWTPRNQPGMGLVRGRAESFRSSGRLARGRWPRRSRLGLAAPWPAATPSADRSRRIPYLIAPGWRGRLSRVGGGTSGAGGGWPGRSWNAGIKNLELAEDLDLKHKGRRTWGTERGVSVSGMGCHGKQGALLLLRICGWLWGTLFPFALLFIKRVLMVQVLESLSLGGFNQLLQYRTVQVLFWYWP
jgi:hypothetical protein